MKKSKVTISIIIILIVLALCCAITIFTKKKGNNDSSSNAANSNVTENTEKIASNFGKSVSDVTVQKFKDYAVTYVGLVDSKDIKNEKLSSLTKENTTYLVAAVESKEGFKDDYSKDKTLCLEPFIQGPSDPAALINIAYESVSLNQVVDGVYYSLAVYKNDINVFADSTVYLGVYFLNGPVDQSKFILDNNNKVVRNENYSEVNGLFQIALDKSKANKEIADAYVTDYENPTTVSSFGHYRADGLDDIEEFLPDSELIAQDIELVDDSNDQYIYGVDGFQHRIYKNWLNEHTSFFEWDYDKANDKLYIINIKNVDSKYLQDVYEYTGDTKDLTWLNNK